MANIETLLRQISKIVVREKTQQEEKRKRGENFNIFDVLGLSTSEVRLHSAFLAELLNPNGNHGLGDQFLEAFIRLVIKKVEPNFEIDTKSCQVFVEHPIGTITKDYTEGGRIDLLIQDKNNHAIVIENKINAGDQYKQLLRYHNWATKNSQKYVLIYLTKNGTEAEEYSAENIDYKRIGYKDEILPWLQGCISIAAVHPIIRETIRQYITNLKDILSIMEQSNLSNMLDILSRDDNFETTITILDLQEQFCDKIKEDFIGNLKSRLVNELKYEFTRKNKDEIEIKNPDFPSWSCVIEKEGGNTNRWRRFLRYNGSENLPIEQSMWSRENQTQPFGWAYYGEKNFDEVFTEEYRGYWTDTRTLAIMHDGSFADEIVDEIKKQFDKIKNLPK